MTRDNSVLTSVILSRWICAASWTVTELLGIGGLGGMALDVEGNIFVAHSTLGTIFVHRANGDLMAKIRSPGNGDDQLDLGRRRIKCIYIVESETGPILRLTGIVLDVCI